MRRFDRNITREFLRYIIVGGICTIIDFLLLYLLTSLCGVHYLVSSAISFLIGVVMNWLLCTYWIFSIHRIRHRTAEFGFYVLISLLGMGLNILLMWVFTDVCSVWYMFSKLFAAMVTLFYNFFARKLLLHTYYE